MNLAAALLPVFVQVGLTLFLGFWLGVERIKAVQRGKVARSAIALSSTGWPVRVRQIGNCYINQFEIPVLFYVAVVLAVQTRTADLVFVVLEWLFVATRIAHAAVHTTSNALVMRFRVFGFGVLVLLILWTILALRILLSRGVVL